MTHVTIVSSDDTYFKQKVVMSLNPHDKACNEGIIVTVKRAIYNKIIL